MGYGVRQDLSSGKKINLDRVYRDVIRPVVTGCGYECVRGDEVLDSGLIDESMYFGILESDLVVADISTLNPNAIYELGVRHGVRKYHTIIMMESSDKFFFDLNHNRTITYAYHRNNNTFDEEATKVRDRLEKIIKSIEATEQIDSPLYTFVNDLQEPLRVGTNKAKGKAKIPVYERIKQATDLRRKEHYSEAFEIFEALARDIPSDPYFIQQMALCTYKQAKPGEIELLEEAYKILQPISETIDPETSGLIGAIFKRRYKITKSEDDINHAIRAYKKAYSLFNDYYNGENYAFCLLLKASICSREDEQMELKTVSRHTYREIYEMFGNFVEDEINTEYEVWMIGTLAACALVLQKMEAYKKLEALFYSRASKMMKTSYREQMGELINLL